MSFLEAPGARPRREKSELMNKAQTIALSDHHLELKFRTINGGRKTLGWRRKVLARFLIPLDLARSPSPLVTPPILPLDLTSPRQAIRAITVNSYSESSALLGSLVGISVTLGSLIGTSVSL